MHSEPGCTTISSSRSPTRWVASRCATPLSGANMDTKASSNATANGIALGNNISGSSDGHLKDFYIDDLTGKGRATTTSPRTAHFSLVDEATPNDDTDFNESANPRGS